MTTSSREASEASCTASCQSCPERYMSRGEPNHTKRVRANTGARRGSRPDQEQEQQQHDPSRDEIAFARDGFTERANNSQCVLAALPIDGPNDRGVGDVLSEEREVRAIVVKFGREPGLGAIWASLLCVRCPGRCTRSATRMRAVAAGAVAQVVWAACPESRSGRRHRVLIHWAWRTPSADGPS